MTGSESTRIEIEAYLKETLAEGATDVRATIGREATLAGPLVGKAPAPSHLPAITFDIDGTPNADFALGTVLGEGGMGVVRLARQHALDRDVAIKQLHRHNQGTDKVAMLLREARLTGRLEHPSIIPIHALGLGGSGPSVVMKRVRGRAWSEDLEALDRRDETALAAQIEVVLRVCDAIDYAHSQGVVHRDLKPTNVMLGDFGEVYVVDWGIAIPAESPIQVHHVAGTPAYMAPEMVDTPPQTLDRRVDIYLLGATLYEILFGRAPHQRDNPLTAMIAASQPIEIPEHDMPQELVDICRRACEVDPDDRYQTVAELRRALRAYFDHRSAAQLASTARARIGELATALTDGTSEHAALIEELGMMKHQLQTALTLWEDNATAKAGLRELVVPTLTCHLAMKNLTAARQLVASLDEMTIDAALLEKLALLESEREDEARAHQRLGELRRERSLEIGRSHRSVMMTFVGLVLTGVVIAVFANRGGLKPAHPELLFQIVLAIGIPWAILAVILRKQIFATFANRATAFGISTSFVAITINRGMALVSGAESLQIIQTDLLLVAVALSMLGSLHPGFLLFGLINAVAYVVAILVPASARILVNVMPLLSAAGWYVFWNRLRLSDQALFGSTEGTEEQDRAG